MRQLASLVWGLAFGRLLAFALYGNGPHYSDGSKPSRPATLADVKVEVIVSEDGVGFKITTPADIAPTDVHWSFDPETRTVTDVWLTAAAPPSTPRG